jgi:hypothetical protein
LKDDRSTGKDLEGSSHGIIEVLSQLPHEVLRKNIKICQDMQCPAEI